MEDNINLNQLWAAQSTGQKPDVSALLLTARKYKKKVLLKMIGSSLLLIATGVFISGIVIYFRPEMLTTKIGVLLMQSAIVAMVAAQLSAAKIFYTEKEENNCAEYLHQLYAMKKKQEYMHTSLMTAYFILLSAGLGLYMIEYARRMQPMGATLSYVITALWIGVNWLYIRPRTIRKQQEKMNEMIQKLEEVSKQL